MIWGKLKQVITMEIYDANGQFLGKQAKYIYEPLLMWYDLAIALFIAILILHQMYMR